MTEDFKALKQTVEVQAELIEELNTVVIQLLQSHNYFKQRLDAQTKDANDSSYLLETKLDEHKKWIDRVDNYVSAQVFELRKGAQEMRNDLHTAFKTMQSNMGELRQKVINRDKFLSATPKNDGVLEKVTKMTDLLSEIHEDQHRLSTALAAMKKPF